MIRFILFDMDGVLVDSEEAIRTAAIEVFKIHGFKVQHEDFFPFIGTGEDNFIGGVAEKYGLIYKTEMKDMVYKLYKQIARKKLNVFPGIIELIRTLQERKIKTAIASAADTIKVRQI